MTACEVTVFERWTPLRQAQPKRPTTPMGWKKVVLFSLLPLLMLAASLEGAARLREIWKPPRAVDAGLGFDERTRVFVPSQTDPDVLVTDPAKSMSFHVQQFTRSKPDGVLRVFLLGGSNVHSLHDKLPAFANALARAAPAITRAEVINLGGLAYGSGRLVPVAAEAGDYEPDLVLIYAGHNEFEELEQLALVDLPLLPVQRWLYQSAVARLLREWLVDVRVAGMRREHNRRILADPAVDYRPAARYRFTPEEVAERMVAYRANLSRMLETFVSRGVPVVLGTLATNLWRPDLAPELRREGRRIQDLYALGRYAEGMRLARRLLRSAGRHQASDAENEIVRALAEEQALPLVDVEEAVAAQEPNGVPGETLMRDRCHLNDAGQILLLRAFAREIVPRLGARGGAAAWDAAPHPQISDRGSPAGLREATR
ncbi:MAG: SGNH/GDSL hydrolase family protein [Myxococcota bacterium]